MKDHINVKVFKGFYNGFAKEISQMSEEARRAWHEWIKFLEAKIQLASGNEYAYEAAKNAPEIDIPEELEGPLEKLKAKGEELEGKTYPPDF